MAVQAAAPAVPLLRLDSADPDLLEELLEVVRRVATAGAFSMGPELEGFEAAFASWCETEFCVGVSSGTEALALALRALEIGPGGEVVVPSSTFIATAEAVVLAGATPRLVDVDPETSLITAEILAAAIGERTRAVMPVHLFGQTVDMDPLLEVARAHGLAVVEDCAQAHGARYRGRRVGTMGDVGCFSFYPTKNLGAWGDGGAIVTTDEGVAERVRLLRSHGERPRYHHRIVGTTARLDGLQAAILAAKLPRLEAWNVRRRELGAALREGLQGAPVELPADRGPDHDHVFHLFVVRTPHRDALREHLAASGISTAVHYPVPVHTSEAFLEHGDGAGSLPVAERLARESLSLPIWPHMDDAEVLAVVEAVHAFAPAQDHPDGQEVPSRPGRSS
jgi:dTDP-3-amino-3,4,6-trideoxy-alpha-D-glucose transaminase